MSDWPIGSTVTEHTLITYTSRYVNSHGVATLSVLSKNFGPSNVVAFESIAGSRPLPITLNDGNTSTAASIASPASSSTINTAQSTSPANSLVPSTIPGASSTQGLPQKPASTQTPTPPQTPATSNGTAIAQDVSSSGVSNGAAAGIAVGMIVAGALIGFLVAWLFFRRSLARRPRPEYVAMQSTHRPPLVDDYDGNYASAKAAAAAASDPSPISPTPTAATLVTPQDALQLSHFLLDTAPDKQLAAELSSLGHLIQQHVEDHYHAAPLQHIDISSLAAALVETGAFTINEASTPAQLAAEPRTRRAALQHVIAKVVLGSVVVGAIGQHGLGGRGLSMLPRSVGSFVAEMKPTERFRGNPEAMSVAFTRWRQLCAFLLSPERSSRGALRPSGPEVSQQAREVVHVLNGFLGPFLVDSDHSSNSSSTAGNGKHGAKSQEAHLEEVVLECTKFGYVLFSQPGEFRLRFETGRNWNEIVVCPGLEKVSDDQGVRRSTMTIMGPLTDGI